MGKDIYGWIEYRNKATDDSFGEVNWYALAEVVSLINRQSWAFALLFGTRHSLDFHPIAASRGLPDNVDWRTKADAEEEITAHSHTWVTWQEILTADGDESVIYPLNPVLSEYRKNASDEWERHGFNYLQSPAGPGVVATRREGDSLFVIERLRLREILKFTDFDFVFELMEVTAKRFGNDYVRLVVWFTG